MLDAVFFMDIKKFGIFFIVLALAGVGCQKPAAPSLVPVTIEQNGTAVTVRANGQILHAFTGKPGEIYSLFQEDQKYAYIAIRPPVLNGYLLYPPGFYTVYRIDLATGSDFKDLSRQDTALQAVSPDGKYAAYAEYGAQKNVVIKEIDSNQGWNVPVPAEYGQFGSTHFSPDSQQLSFAAAVGFPGKERGAVFIVDLKNEQVRLIAQSKAADSYFSVNGWKSNNTVDYAERPAPDQQLQ